MTNLPPLHFGYKPRVKSTRPKIAPPKAPSGNGCVSSKNVKKAGDDD